MENTQIGVLISVNDLAKCRAFYCCLFGVAEPSVDSAFNVGFRNKQGISLYLEACNATWIEHENSATSFILGPADIGGVIRRMEAEQLPLTLRQTGDVRLFRGIDPEGNVFYMYSDRPLENRIYSTRVVESTMERDENEI